MIYVRKGYALEKTSCGDGKWCQAGVCVEDPSAPRGTCLLEDNVDFCRNLTSKTDFNTTCADYNVRFGRCCKYCDPSATVIQRMPDQNVRLWLSRNVSSSNVAFLPSFPPSTTTTLAPTKTSCYDLTSCSFVTILRYIGIDLCKSNYFYIKNPVREACKKFCGLC